MPTITLPRPHAAQQQVLREAERFNVLCMGRRWGKSYLGADLLIHPALQGYPVGLFTPAYKYLSESWRQLKGILLPITKRVSEQEHRLELVTGGVIECWSLDNKDAGRSRKYKRIVVDEAALVDCLEEAWEESLRPTLTDFGGDCWFLSTPRGYDYFHELWTRGQEPDRKPGWKSWRMPTISNPFISPAEVELARLEMTSRRFEQEYEATFSTSEGMVFQGVDDCITSKPQGPEPGRRYFLGADLAMQGDYSAISVIDDTLRQVYVHRMNRCGWDTVIARIENVAREYNAICVVEVNSIGDPIIEQLEKRGLKVDAFRTTAQSKPQIIDSLALAIERTEISLLPDPVQTDELKSYQYIQSGSHYKMSAPAGKHDDHVISLALSLHGIHSWRKARMQLL